MSDEMFETVCPECGKTIKVHAPEDMSWQNGYDIGYCTGNDDATESQKTEGE